ncbi:hypothetical protein KTAU_01530 [Thermogemmatispora aurantia]|uniref:Uncharacterized protein n=1 Tax=Thermogemmatispora aurantia TaxID=2045279 RepID=A0A5J4K0W1_9CHLR|nr:hypothetical protein KTAU_01530 [Thermogemmatispora aurantia]
MVIEDTSKFVASIFTVFPPLALLAEEELPLLLLALAAVELVVPGRVQATNSRLTSASAVNTSHSKRRGFCSIATL